MLETKRAFCSWSGGKESALALYLAKKSGIDVAHLLNMISEHGEYSRSHGIKTNCLRSQSEAIGIPILQQRASWQNYEKEFKKAASELRRKNMQGGIFGDIDLQEHRDWVEKICSEIDINPILPLWKNNRESLLNEFIRAGFKAIIVTLKPDFLDKQWLGRQIDEALIRDLKRTDGVDICGERGEYHTFVFDGPIFKKPLKFLTGRKVCKNNFCFLELAIV